MVIKKIWLNFVWEFNNCIPLFHHQQWRNMRSMIKDPPLKYTSVHIIKTMNIEHLTYKVAPRIFWHQGSNIAFLTSNQLYVTRKSQLNIQTKFVWTDAGQYIFRCPVKVDRCNNILKAYSRNLIMPLHFYFYFMLKT